MAYQTVYDAARALPAGWILPAIGAAATLILTVLGPRRSMRVILGAASFTIVSGAIVTWNYLSLRAVETRCETIVGAVSQFEPMPFAGGQRESFQVSGVAFQYSDYEPVGGFNKTASHGGPIRPGLPVRICYVQRSGYWGGNRILRLEIAR